MVETERKKYLVVFVLIFLGLSALSIGVVLSSPVMEETDIVLINKRGLDTDTLAMQVYTILADYEQFVLVETTEGNKGRLLSQGYTVEVLDGRDHVSLNHLSFDVGDGVPEIPGNLEIERYPFCGRGYYLLQFIGPIKPQWQDQLVQMGVRLHEFRYRYNYIVEMDSDTLRRVEDLSFVNWIGIYQPAYKFDHALMDEPGTLKLDITVFRSADPIVVAERIELIGGDIIYVDTEFSFITAELPASKISTLANFHNVNNIILGCSHLSVYNNHATWITQTNAYGNRKVTEHGVIGTDELVTVCDSEIEGDGGPPTHEQFVDPDGNPIGDLHRKFQEVYEIGGGNLNDGAYHGTHVAGTVLGDAAPYYTYNSYDGHAIGARLIFQDIGARGDGSVSAPSNMYTDAYQPSYNAGSRTHTNSWGGGSGYGTNAVHSDTFMWDNKDYNIVYAMANDGPGPNTLSAQAEGKNVISVGAVGNFAGHDNMAGFSSRGYASDGRIKPTIVHVGAGVNSANRDGGYSNLGGTSMATPGIAGQVAQVRQYYSEGWYPTGNPVSADGFNPSSALTRATLINGAVEITGSGTHLNDERFPNGDQGYGRSQLDRVLHFEGDARNLIVYDSWNHGVELTTGQSWSMEIEVEDPGQSVEVTLAWTDYPSSSGGGIKIVNDLDLELIAPSGTRYVGNAYTGFSPGYSEADPSSNPWSGSRSGEWDGLNVEENILLLPETNDIEIGIYQINVYAHNVAQGSQDFAIVASGPVVLYEGAPGEPPAVVVTYPNGGETFEEGQLVDITWVSTQGDSELNYVDLWYSPDGGNSWVSIATEQPEDLPYSWIVPNENSGDCMVRVRVTDVAGRRGNGFSTGTFNIIGSPPAPPSNLAVEHYGGPTLVTLDDFQDGDYTSDPTWTVYDGSWSVDGSGGNYWLEGQGQISTPFDQAYGKWDLDYQLVRTGDVGGNFQLIRFYFILDQPQPDATSFSGYFVIITGDVGGEGQINLWRFNNGQQADSPLISGSWTPNTDWNTLGIERNEAGEFTLLLNGNIVGISPPDNTHTTSEYIGFRNQGGDASDLHRISEIRTTIDLETEHNRITWDASPDDPHGVSQYEIYRSESPSGLLQSYEHIGSVEADGSEQYEYVDEFTGTSDDIIWWYIVRALGSNGLEEQNNNPAPEPGDTETFDIPITAGGAADGWNFVSFNLIPLSNSLEGILSDVAGSYDRVMYYDASSGSWSSYMPGRAERYNDLATWNRQMGLWIRATTSDTITVQGTAPLSTDITLYNGWNMVGLPSSTAGTHGLPGVVDRIAYFDASADNNIVYGLEPSSFVFEPGKAYMVHNPSENPVVWTVDY